MKKKPILVLHRNSTPVPNYILKETIIICIVKTTWHISENTMLYIVTDERFGDSKVVIKAVNERTDNTMTKEKDIMIYKTIPPNNSRTNQV